MKTNECVRVLIYLYLLHIQNRLIQPCELSFCVQNHMKFIIIFNIGISFTLNFVQNACAANLKLRQTDI